MGFFPPFRVSDVFIVQGLFMQRQFWERQSHGRRLGILALTVFLSRLP